MIQRLKSARCSDWPCQSSDALHLALSYIQMNRPRFRSPAASGFSGHEKNRRSTGMPDLRREIPIAVNNAGLCWLPHCRAGCCTMHTWCTSGARPTVCVTASSPVSSRHLQRESRKTCDRRTGFRRGKPALHSAFGSLFNRRLTILHNLTKRKHSIW